MEVTVIKSNSKVIILTDYLQVNNCTMCIQGLWFNKKSKPCVWYYTHYLSFFCIHFK